MSVSMLGQVPLFATLPAEEIARLAATLRPLELAAGSILIHEGEVGSTFYLVLGGELEVVKALDTPDERLLQVHGPGGYLGEMSLLNPDGLRTASVRARTAVQLLELARAEIEPLLRRHPALAFELARSLSLRLQQADNTTIRDLHEKNRQLTAAYQELQAAQAQLIEKQTMERELQLAREIQESMLPRILPRLKDFDFAAHMLPARAVGGDFFDIFPLSRNRVGIVIGDVSSKGVPAALFMALTRSLMRAEANRVRVPMTTLQRVNQHLGQMNEAHMFVTLLYGVLDRRTRTFAYARAGHELPIVLDRAGELHMPPRATGVPLGLFPDGAIDEQMLTLPPGSTLFLYTDGVTDATDEQGAFYGIEQLCDTLRPAAGAPAAVLCSHVLASVVRHQGTTPQFDDITVVGVHSC